MRLATVRAPDGEVAAVVGPDGPVIVGALNAAWGTDLPTSLLALIQGGHVAELARRPLPTDAPASAHPYGPPWRRPGKIWGIGLNYRDHAADLDAELPAQPASFMKPTTAVIGPGDAIVLPPQSRRVTAEAELGVVIGRRAHNLRADEVEDAVLGFTTIIDMTAEDILRQNPRYLTRAKSFDTFFSYGPVLVTRDEVPDVRALTVSTVVNGEVRARNTVANMTFDPWELVRFHAEVMTLEPGDIISTGTPGAAVIEPGDVARCEITGFPSLENPVRA